MLKKLTVHLLRQDLLNFWSTQRVQRYTIPTIGEVKQKLKSVVRPLEPWSSDESRDEKDDDSPPTAKSQEELMPRLMKESYYEAIIPLTNEAEREHYTSLYDTVRFGKLLENLDTFAVHISYRHNAPSFSASGRSPLSIVTAMVDEVKIHKRVLDLNNDILMKGHVSYVGNSSMEIKMWLMQHAQPVIDAMFVMVARDKDNKSAFVHPLQLMTNEEKGHSREGETRHAIRLEERKSSLLQFPPREEERSIVHQLFMQTLDKETKSFRGRKLPDGHVWMEDTKLKNLTMCFPDKRNIHNKIFGGFLMRQGFELAWANACIFSRTRPIIKTVDDIMFRCPVPIGSILLISSQVCFSEGTDFHIRVHAEVLNPHDGKSSTSNTFDFTFSCDKQVPTVMPKTYGEAMLYLDGRRHFEAYKASQG